MDQDDNQLIAERREKLAAIRRQGIAFPNDFKPTHHADELLRQYDPLPGDELAALDLKVSVGGRMMLKRVMGKAAFGTLQDGSMGPAGSRIQLFLTQDALGEELYAAFKHWDLGDIIG